MTDFGIAIEKRNAFANYVFDRKWEAFKNRTIENVYVDGQNCTIHILFYKLPNDEFNISVTYEEFLHRTGIKESEFIHC